MGAMSACIGGMNSYSSKEVKFNIVNSPNFSLEEKRRKFREQQKSNSRVFVPIKNNEEEKSNKEDFYKKQIIINNNINDIKKDKDNEIKNNKGKAKGKINIHINKKIIRNLEDYCDIIECEDEFECDNSIRNADLLSEKRINYLPIQKIAINNLDHFKSNAIKENGKEIAKEEEKDIDNEKEINNGILNESFNNNELNMELSATKRKISFNENQRSTIFNNLINSEENGGKTLENENNKSKKENKIKENNNNKNNIVINDYYEGGITNLKYNKLYKITKPNNLSFNKTNPEKISFKDNKNNVKENIKNAEMIKKSSTVKNSNKKNIEFNNCKIDNNINFNISNNKNSYINNNQNNNLNNINNNFNNISSINSDFNNNNCIDITSNMSYFLSLEKSQRKATSSRFDKNILSLKKHNFNNNASYSKEISSNNYRNSVRVNKYKWKLLPNHKYNTQIYKSLVNIPFSRESQSLLISESEQKNLNLTPINNKNEKNNTISEMKKQKDAQDKEIKSLKNRIKSLENKMNEEKNIEEKNIQKITKLEEYMNKNHIKNNNTTKKIEKKVRSSLLSEINLVESQKDFRIKKLEEQLNNAKKDNKLNKTLLKKKDEQIKNLLEKKNKQDVIIKQYEVAKNKKNKNNTTKGNKKISLLEDSSITNNNITINPNNTSETKNSISERRIYKNNLNNSTQIKNNNIESKDLINQKMRVSLKNESSLNIQKKFFNPNNSSNLSDYFGLDQGNTFKVRTSMRESSKLKLSNRYIKSKNIQNNKQNNFNNHNRSSVNISYNNYCNDLCNKAKRKYSNKITLNKMKIYKLNKAQDLTLFNENKTNRILDISKNSERHGHGIKENFNVDINIANPNTTKSMKKFSFSKSKKLLKKNSEKNLTEMYLQAGTAQNEETSTNNMNTNTNNDLFLLTQKNSFTQSNNNTTTTNKNNNINMPISPLFSPSNISDINFENFRLDDKLNVSENAHNINMYNPYFKSISNDKIEKENNIYQNLWKEGYLRYKQLKENENKENKIENNDDNIFILIFCMANELIYLNANKEDLMSEIKNKFLDIFLKEKNYEDNEKKYITNNILFLNKEGIIDIDKTIKENNLNNGDIIVTVLKDVT